MRVDLNIHTMYKYMHFICYKYIKNNISDNFRICICVQSKPMFILQINVEIEKRIIYTSDKVMPFLL